MSPKALLARPNSRRRHPRGRISAAGAALAQRALNKAADLTRGLPVPAVLARHISKGDATFIAIAYAIPLPGTGLVAAAIVGGKIGARHLRGRLKPLPAAPAYRG